MLPRNHIAAATADMHHTLDRGEAGTRLRKALGMREPNPRARTTHFGGYRNRADQEDFEARDDEFDRREAAFNAAASNPSSSMAAE